MTTGENLAARVQQAQAILATGDEIAMIAYLLGRNPEEIERVATRIEKDTRPEQDDDG